MRKQAAFIDFARWRTGSEVPWVNGQGRGLKAEADVAFCGRMQLQGERTASAGA